MFSCTQICKLAIEKKFTRNEPPFENQKIIELFCLFYSSQGPAVLRVFYLILNAKPAWKKRRHSCTITPHGLKPGRLLRTGVSPQEPWASVIWWMMGFYQNAADHTESLHRTGSLLLTEEGG